MLHIIQGMNGRNIKYNPFVDSASSLIDSFELISGCKCLLNIVDSMV